MPFWAVISAIIGWLYFAAWSISFYPQLILNYRRKSVSGFSLDFGLLNLFGFCCYAVYSCAFLFSGELREEYRRRNANATRPQVQINDAVFALHAALLSSMILGQAYFCGYERGRQQSISTVTKCFVALVLSITTIQIFLVSQNKMHWIDVVYFFSYIKLLITVIKCLPQLLLNYRRKSTVGWSIIVVLLDFLGGVLSITRNI